VDPIEAYYVSVFFGVTVVAMCIGFGLALFHLDGAEENAWHAARVRAERLGVFPRALPRYPHRFDGSPWWLLRMLLAAASLALAQSLIPCWVRLHSGSPCGGDTPGSRFVVGWNAIVSAMIAMLFGIVGTLGFESLEEFRLIRSVSACRLLLLRHLIWPVPGLFCSALVSAASTSCWLWTASARARRTASCTSTPRWSTSTP
jgi:hypothetical protein